MAIERPPAQLDRVFELETRGPDVWIGESPMYHWGRIYGGLVIAQALWAATQTVDTAHSVHSLHSYFILGGDPDQPVRYEVDRIRNGRSFTTRRVTARQSTGAIFALSCSFQRFEEGVETQTADFPTEAGTPGHWRVEGSSPTAWRVEGNGAHRFDVALERPQPRSLVWCRYPLALGDDPRAHACALAYLSDTNMMDAVAASHPRGLPDEEDWDQVYMSASLDHAMWFHRPCRADDWLLFATEGQGILRTRGLSTSHVFDPDGQHVATVAQEGLIRTTDEGNK